MSGATEAAETAVMTSHEPYTVTPNSTGMAQTPAIQNQLMEQQMNMSYANTAYRQPVGSSPLPYQSIPTGGTLMNQMNSGDQKRKRGRPRKYGPDGGMASSQQPIAVSMPPNYSSPTAAPPPPHMESQLPVSGSMSPTVKKARGRPPGSSNKKQREEALGSTGIGFIPHVLNVKAGEDIASKIMAFSQNGPRAVCVLSANGAIANVTLRQAATSGGTATYEGRYDILSLSGSFMLMEVGGQKTRTGGLSITLAGPDGRVFGGCLAGVLLAASPVQVIVGSFIADSRQEQRPANHMEPSSSAALQQQRMNNMGGGGGGGSSSPSRGTLSESSGGPASPFNLSSGMPGLTWK